MVLRKITIDNSIRYIPKKEQAKEIKQNPTKKIKVKEFNLFQEEVNQTKIFHKTVKKSWKMWLRMDWQNLKE